MKQVRSTGGWFVRVLPKLAGVALTLLLVGCNCSPVARDLSQHEANQIIALLNSSGISSSAEMERGARGRYRVDAQCSAYSAAVGILAAHDLPSRVRASVELLSQQTLLPSSRQFELLRVDHALSLEVEDLFRGIPGVDDARVVVRSHSVPEGGRPSVAIALAVQPGSKLEPGAVLPVLQKAVAGVTSEDITISIHEREAKISSGVAEGAVREGDMVVRVPLVPFFAWRVADDDYSGLALTFIGVIMIVGGVAVAVGYYFGSLTKRERGGELGFDRGRKELPEG